MKNFLILTLILFSTTALFSQEDWGSVDKNKVTMKEIGPIWPGCEEGSASERSNCFNTKLSSHIAKNFKYPAEA